MQYEELIRARFSVRKFQDRPVKPQQLNAILEAGRIAPTAGNRQPQRILVVQGREGLEKMKQCTPCHFDAPLILLVCYDRTVVAKNSFGDKRTYGTVDASIVLTQMMLEAHDQGLGTVWVGLFDPQRLAQCFHIPEQYEILSLMPIGYPAADAAPSPMHFDKHPMEHTVFHESF